MIILFQYWLQKYEFLFEETNLNSIIYLFNWVGKGLNRVGGTADTTAICFVGG